MSNSLSVRVFAFGGIAAAVALLVGGCGGQGAAPPIQPSLSRSAGQMGSPATPDVSPTPTPTSTALAVLQSASMSIAITIGNACKIILGFMCLLLKVEFLTAFLELLYVSEGRYRFDPCLFHVFHIFIVHRRRRGALLLGAAACKQRKYRDTHC